MKTKKKGTYDTYKKILDLINESKEKLYYLGWSLDDMLYHGWSREARKNEIDIYEKVENKVKELKSLLEDVLDVDKEE